MGAFVGKLCKSVFQAIKDLAICGAKTYANTDWLTDILTQACCWLDDWMTGRPTDGGFQPTKMKVKNCVHVNTSHISVMPRNQPTQTKPNRTKPGSQYVSHSMSRLFSVSDSSADFDSDSESDSGLFCLRNAFLTFYWLKRQHWGKHTNNTHTQWVPSAGRKCKYLTTFFFHSFSFSFGP